MTDGSKLRAWYFSRQGIDGALQGKAPAKILSRAGWARSVGGSSPYLGLFARGGLGRDAVDNALATGDICELPSARGCTYVLPEEDFALGLKVGQGYTGGELKIALKLGATEQEIDKLCERIIASLERGPLDPEGLREAAGPAVRNFGAEGQKKGLTTTLPVALERLQAAGEIRRVPVEGRLDRQRYRYALWRPNPLAGFGLSAEDAFAELAGRYFAWIGPARLSEFQWFSGLGAKAARAAVEHLKLEPLDAGDDRLMLPGDRAAFEAFRVPDEPHYALPGALDSLFLLRRELKGLLDAADLDRQVFVDKGTRPLGGLSDLPSHAIVDRGRIVGLWEYDQPAGCIVWMPFVQPDSELKEAVRQMERFVREQLGDARSFSLDSPKSRAPRIAALRNAAAARD